MNKYQLNGNIVWWHMQLFLSLLQRMYSIIKLIIIKHKYIFIIRFLMDNSMAFICSLHNPSVNRQEAIPHSFLENYLTVYIPSIDTKQIEGKTHFIVALLQFNTLLIKHLSNEVLSVCSVNTNYLYEFAWSLYKSGEDLVVSWSLLYLCQHANSYPVSPRFAASLFINSLHLYRNAHITVIYRSIRLLYPGKW